MGMSAFSQQTPPIPSSGGLVAHSLFHRLQVPCWVADGLRVLLDDASRPQLLARDMCREARVQDSAWMKRKRAHSVRLPRSALHPCTKCSSLDR
jgi:hypothetical protein